MVQLPPVEKSSPADWPRLATGQSIRLHGVHGERLSGDVAEIYFMRRCAGMKVCAAQIFTLVLFFSWTCSTLLAGEAFPTGKVARLSIDGPDEATRSYFAYVPEGVRGSDTEVPLLVTLAGSQAHSKLMVEKWTGIADRIPMVVVSPEPSASRSWELSADGPPFFYNLIEEIKESLPIDGRRVYLFGHSGGGTFGLVVGLLEPGYFAAVTVLSGGLPTGKGYLAVDAQERHIPILLLTGSLDSAATIAEQTKESLLKLGFSVSLRSVFGIGHDYYRNSRFLNDAAWEFLEQQSLEYPPYWKEYNFR